MTARSLAWIVGILTIGVLAGLLLRSTAASGPDLASEADNDSPVPEAAERPRRFDFTVSVSGDILIHSPVWANAQANAAGGGGAYDFAPMFSAIRPRIAGAELAICHLETPVGAGEPTGFPIFRAPLELIDAIAATGWDACDTASNHSLDQGMGGIEETVRALRQAGIAQTGSAFRQPVARQVPILRAGPVRLALLAYTDQTNGIPPPTPWSVNLLPAGESARSKAARVATDTRRALAAGADGALVSIQWGDENAGAPDSSQLRLARAVARIDGVAAIAGQGPHVVQPIRRVGGKFVIFSSGNLISNQSSLAGLPTETQDGLIGLLRFRAVLPPADGGAETASGATPESDEAQVTVRRVDYVPTWVRLEDHLVEPVDWGLRHDPANAGALRASWQRTVAVAGHGSRIAPLPRRLP